jgi:hypothetical protein
MRLIKVQTDVLQLPTVPSDIEQLKATVSGVLAKISQLPLEQLVAQLDDVMHNANQTLKVASDLVANVDTQVKPLSDSAIKAQSDGRGRGLFNHGVLRYRLSEFHHAIGYYPLSFRRPIRSLPAWWRIRAIQCSAGSALV